MSRNLTLITVCILAIGLISPASAIRIGGLMGYAHYLSGDGSVSSFALSAYAERQLGRGNFYNSFTVGYCIGTLYGDRFSDLTLGTALTYYFQTPEAKAVPYIGADLQLHILSAGRWTSAVFFGSTRSAFGAFAGVGINISKSAQIPIQANYGLLLIGSLTVHIFTVKIGYAVNF
jgi:hypothetical protein